MLPVHWLPRLMTCDRRSFIFLREGNSILFVGSLLRFVSNINNVLHGAVSSIAYITFLWMPSISLPLCQAHIWEGTNGLIVQMIHPGCADIMYRGCTYSPEPEDGLRCFVLRNVVLHYAMMTIVMVPWLLLRLSLVLCCNKQMTITITWSLIYCKSIVTIRITLIGRKS